MLLYLVSNKTPEISFGVHLCAWCTHNNKSSNDMSMKRIYQYLQVIDGKDQVLNSSKKMVVDCYVDAYFAGTR